MAVEPALPVPIQLSSSAFLHIAAPEVGIRNISDSTNGPRLVILATWVFAQDNHITKYVTSYRELFPHTAVLVVKCYLRHFFWFPTAREELVPAASAIRKALSIDGASGQPGCSEDDSKPPSLVLHLFSNSGLGTAQNLCDVYAITASVNENDTRLPRHATILDSSPGRYEFLAVARAAMCGVPKGRWAQHLVTLPLAYLLSACLWVWVHIFQGKDWVGIWAEAINDPTNYLETCRSYAYSDADPLVRRHLVEQHAENATTEGFKVLHRADFVDSAHVSHARADPIRYWRLVKETWEGRLGD
ncbi:hypothetical protein EDB81DRAFT_667078 [Dactylonectria macrodidyma]|uniref:Transmembrane protein 53 n=1 Tax=Dactylonectria macrodidyma TaxID=307937 RepID=A0A9P9IIC1_9HYPO|nr:hypothetical protein EDB81DRAFT_667078 [Dactylonectria macrodidyma]